MTREMIVIVPSRGRPENMRRLIQAWEDTEAEAWLLMAVDEDDPQLDAYCTLWDDSSFNFGIYIGPRLRLCGTLNALAVEQAPDFKHISFLGDDHLPRTKHWDRLLIDALEKLGSGIAYGDDLWQHENIPTAVAMTSDIVKALGYMVPPGFVHLYVDDVWKAWGLGMGALTYLPNVVLEHLHPDAGGKGAMDPGYAEAWTNYGPDEARFKVYRDNGEMRMDIEKLRGLR